MKIMLNNPTSIQPKKNQSEIFNMNITRIFHGLLMISLVFTLAACNLSQKGSSGGGSSSSSGGGTDSNGTSIPGKPASPQDAGTAVLNMNRIRSYDDSNGSDTQEEIGTVPLVFSTSTEGPLIVEGNGKIQWTEKANYNWCGFTAKADGTVSVRGLFNFTTCKFDLTLTISYSQPTTSDQSPDCTYSVVFSQTEFTSKIELDPVSPREIHSMPNDVWDISTVKLTDLKSEQVQTCKADDLNFTPEVIEQSTKVP